MSVGQKTRVGGLKIRGPGDLGVAGRRAGVTGWALVLPIAYGLLVGGIILVLQALLQPGREPFHP
jgi:hypothetical protein